MCQLGKAPIAFGPAPREAQVFKTTGGPVLMTEAGPPGREREVRIISCQLARDADVYRSADGALRDLPSNQPFWPIGWDAAPPQQLAGQQGLRGLDGPQGLRGLDGQQGLRGLDGQQNLQGSAGVPPPEKKSGRSWVKPLLIGLGAAAVGYGVYRCVRQNGFCRGGGVNVSQIVTLGGPVPITVIQR
ncbi:MAG: hypothetical protein Q7R67_01460 [bacterium]|nr:hypothetical protein [bacterium]